MIKIEQCRLCNAKFIMHEMTLETSLTYDPSCCPECNKESLLNEEKYKKLNFYK